MGMAAVPLDCRLSDLKKKSSYLNTCLHKRSFSNIILQFNYIKYIYYIITGDDTTFKQYGLLSYKQYKKEDKISTVAAYASELDLTAANENNNFEYDDNEWDIGIGNLIIDLDADIEKTRDEKLNLVIGMASNSSASPTNNQIPDSENLSSLCSDTTSFSGSGQLSSASSALSTITSAVTCSVTTESHNLQISCNANNSSLISTNTGKVHSVSAISGTGHNSKMTVEHSATVDKGLKMKIKRTKPGTKSSEAKHEIVKSNEINGSSSNKDEHDIISSSSISLQTSKISQCSHNVVDSQCAASSNKPKSTHSSVSVTIASNPSIISASKRNSNSHRREKGRDKYEKLQSNHVPQQTKLEANETAKQAAQNHTIVSIASASSSTTTITTLSPVCLDHTSPENQTIQTGLLNSIPTVHSVLPSTSSSINSLGNNSNQPTTLTSESISQPTQGPLLCSKSAAFSVPKNNVNGNEISTCSSTYSANIVSTICSTINADPLKCSTSISINHSTLSDGSLDTGSNSPPAKKLKSILETDLKEMTDVCVGTSIGTITEPDCLGPCEPGTSVTLEGIVWHETEGGVLVINITWRGKTYVGTLLDCTRHDWAPPRFCDSPTSDLDARTPKGRAKRGRAAANAVPANDLSNFTETRTSVHSKLRNNGVKGRKGVQGSPAASPNSIAFVSPRVDSAAKRKPRYPEEEDKYKRKVPLQTVSSASPPASPLLLECPEPNCSKKYRNINGLKYHQSHAHGSTDDDDTKEVITSMSENDESNIETPSPVTPTKSPLHKIDNTATRLNSPSTNAVEPSSVESSLTLHVTLPTVESQTSILSVHDFVKPSILTFENQDDSISINSASPIIQASEMHKQLKISLTNSESPKFLSTNSASPNQSPPFNNTSSPQYNASNLIIPSQLQHHIESPLFQSAQSLQVQQPVSQQVTATTISSQNIHQSLPESPSQNLQVHSQNQLSDTHPASNQQLNNLSSAEACQHNVLHNLSDQISSESSINQTISPGALSIQNVQTHLQSFSNIGLHSTIPQFKVKPTAALMPEQDRTKDSKQSRISSFKKKSRKSPGRSPRESPLETIIVDSGRDDVQSPAYSDISDDATPVDEVDTHDKLLKQNQEKDIKSSPQHHLSTHFNMYPYYGQPSYLIENIQDKTTHNIKVNEAAAKNDIKTLNIVSLPALANMQSLHSDKEKKDATLEQVQLQSQSHYFTNYNTYVSAAYPFQSQPENSQNANQVVESEFSEHKHKMKQESQSQTLKEKHLENHQILKESIEIKSQMSPYQLYNNSHNQRPSPTSGIISDERRYYIYPGEQRRKEDLHKQNTPQKFSPLNSKHQSKQEKSIEILKNDEVKIKQEGVKPTMETQGPPPPPTSQYAYIHPGYLPSHHYGSIPYDPGHHGIYRNLTPMIVSGTYTSNPYLHHVPRYHTPEDLSRSPTGKALDLLQHHANQYYTAHKIHELQERALKSPTPKPSTAASSPLSTIQPVPVRSPNNRSSNSSGSSSSSQSQSTISKQGQNTNQQQHQQQSSCGDSNSSSLNKDNRSPPPQRHVHTHHHTHVGLGYPILPGQYPAPYGAAVLASQQAAAVAATVIAPFPPK